MEMKKEFYYRVQLGDNLAKICQKFNTSKQNILRNNNEIDFYAGELIKITQNDFEIHHVAPTETLEKIASAHGVSVQSLKDFNNLQTNKLFIGQTLKIKKS